MYDGFAYISKYGILKKDDYTPYTHRTGKCAITESALRNQKHIDSIGYVEHDGRTNYELKELLQNQPISIAIHTTGMFSGYRFGVLTEKYLRCSNPSYEVNHGVLLVGYGKVDRESMADRVSSGSCSEYWIVRNSWGSSWGDDGFFKLCADGLGSDDAPYGTCLINKYATWPTFDLNDINPDDEPTE